MSLLAPINSKNTTTNTINKSSLYNKYSLKALDYLFSFFDTKQGTTDFINNTVSYETDDKQTYVVSRQPSIQEIWVSSPISGSNKFKMSNIDFVNKKGTKIFDFLQSEVK